jgi:catalase
LTGTFKPTSTAEELSYAPHFSASTPITARFSSSTGIPVIPDFDPNGDPRGFAIRFNLPEKNGRRVHTDIVAHSVPYFPTRTGAEFLEFLQALIATASSKESPSPVEKFLGSHPGALAFVQAPKPTPKSFAQEPYFGVNAFKFSNAEGKETYGRYRIKPDAGIETYDAEEVKSKGENFLREELRAGRSASHCQLSWQKKAIRRMMLRCIGRIVGRLLIWGL